MNTSDPYAAPGQRETQHFVAPAEPPDRVAWRVFRLWESLRVWYNVVLFCVVSSTGIYAGDFSAITFASVLQMMGAAVVANICFLAGPFAETCVAVLGFKTDALRWILLSLGTAASSALAFAYTMLLVNPNL